MKPIIFSAAIISVMISTSCGSSAKQEAEIQQAKQQTLDSIARVQTAGRLEQLRQDSLKNAQELEQRHVASSITAITLATQNRKRPNKRKKA